MSGDVRRTTAKIFDRGTGWLPPRPDLRDYSDAHEEVAAMVSTLFASDHQPSDPPPTFVDLREWCSPIEDQGYIGSCTAHAAVGVVEYFQNRAFGKHIDGSRLFVYKTTRHLMQETGDSGAWLRSAMGALVLCGVPDEKYWPYTDDPVHYDAEPPSFVYAIADNFEAVKYFRHDVRPTTGGETLASVKKYLAAGVPSMFGYWTFPSHELGDAPGSIPYPCSVEESDGGHALVAVGYDDEKEIVNTVCNEVTKGALLVRNSWGESWGQQGYGWFPYQYVTDEWADEFWSLLSMDWVETGKFG